MFGLSKKPASNETVEAVPVFGVDPNGAALFHGLTNQIAAHLNTARPVMDLTHDGDFGGWAPAQQQMAGLAWLGGGGSAPRTPTGETFSQGAFQEWSPAERIFLQRMQEGRYS